MNIAVRDNILDARQLRKTIQILSRQLREANQRLEEIGQVPVAHIEDMRAAFEEECAKHDVTSKFILATKHDPMYADVRYRCVGKVCMDFSHLSLASRAKFFGLTRKTIAKAMEYAGGVNA